MEINSGYGRIGFSGGEKTSRCRVTESIVVVQHLTTILCVRAGINRLSRACDGIRRCYRFFTLPPERNKIRRFVALLRNFNDAFFSIIYRIRIPRADVNIFARQRRRRKRRTVADDTVTRLTTITARSSTELRVALQLIRRQRERVNARKNERAALGWLLAVTVKQKSSGRGRFAPRRTCVLSPMTPTSRQNS